MTIIEQRTMDAIQAINRKTKDCSGIDWEQRRYELARDIFVARLALPSNRLSLTIEGDAITAIDFADEFIETYQRTNQ